MKKNRSICTVFLLIMGVSFAQEVFEGYTLFTPYGGFGEEGATTFLIDNSYNIIQSWDHSHGVASMPYLIPGENPGWENTLLIYPYRVDHPTMESGGVGGAVQCLNWEGELIWEYVLSNADYQHHHDVEPLPNGNVLLIAWEKKTSSEGFAMGREEINNPLNQMWSEAIFEIQPDGNGSAEVVWEWHLWDHLVQDYCLSCPNYASISEHPELFNINNGDVGTPSAPGGADGDWIHINAIHYHEEWDQIIISSRYQNEIFVIDHSTTSEEASGHTGGNYGKGGDFLYRWGNPQNYNRGDNSDQILIVPHGINWIQNGYPGEGNFILFNNLHNGNPISGNSAVIEFIPPVDENGNYLIDVSEPYGPETYIWSYEENIFSSFQSGAFRLPNGNTLITDCDSAHILEITDSGDIVWEYLDSGDNTTSIARAQKYALDYFDSNTNLLGDINGDEVLNILDLVSLVNLILNDEYLNTGDLNDDNILNILDIVLMTNLILSNET